MRFEYTFEALWKSIKEYLRIEGLICTTPLQCFKEAYKCGIIEEKYEELLFEMIDKRNRIVHIYGLEEARDIYQFVKKEDVYLAISSICKNLQNL